MCAKHRKGAIIRRGAEQQQPQQQQQQQQQPGYQPQQPLYQQPQQQQQATVGYPQQQPGYQPVGSYPDNPPPYPGPPLDNPTTAAVALPPMTKNDYDRQPAFNPNP